MNYDFTKNEIDFINKNARFNDRQQEIFDDVFIYMQWLDVIAFILPV